METFQDVVDANLTLIVSPNKPNLKKSHGIEEYERFLNNALPSKRSFEECACTLMEHQTITCFGREKIAFLIIHNYGKEEGRLRLKILREMQRVWRSGIVLAGGSSYKNLLEHITCALVESCISSEWHAAYIPKEKFDHSQVKLFEEESSSSSKILSLMIILLLIGY